MALNRVKHSLRQPAAIAAGLALAVVAAAGLAAVIAAGYPPASLDVRSSQAWLASWAVGQVALVDGSTGDVAARLPTRPGLELAVAQAGAGALLATRSGGQVAAVDPVIQQVGDFQRPLPRVAGSLRVVVSADGGGAFALDPARGTAVPIDPVTGAAAGRQLALAAELDPAAAVLDGSGRLWAIDLETGELIRLDEGGKRVIADVASPGAGALVPAAAGPVVIDPIRRRAALVEAAGGQVARRGCVDLRHGEEFFAAGGAESATGGEASSDLVFLVVPDREVLLITDLSRGDCSRVVTLGAGRLGPPVAVADRVLVPNYSTGQVHIVSLDGDRLVGSPQVLPPGLDSFELIERGGTVFYNDPGSERAGVLRLRGEPLPVQKYDPDHPGRGLSRDAGGRSPDPAADAARSAEDPADDSAQSADQPTRPATSPTPRTAAPAPGGLVVRISRQPAVAGEPVGLAAALAPGAVGDAVQDAQWSFGDGSAADSGVQVAHSWPAPGEYQVTVRAVTAQRRTLWGTLTLRVVDPADASPAPTGAPTVTGTPPVLTSPASSRPTGSPSASGTAASPVTTGTASGTTSSSTATSSTTVVDQPPTAALDLSATEVETGQEVRAVAGDSADDQGLTRLVLSWGDGTASTASSASAADWQHAYSAPGSYRVTLTVTDSAGQTDTATGTVAVSPAPVVVASGTVMADSLDDLDLDTGSPGPRDVVADIFFLLGPNNEPQQQAFLLTSAGTGISRVAAAGDCPGAAPSSTRLPLLDGGIYCVATSAGQRSSLTATAVGPTFRFTYTTWRIE